MAVLARGVVLAVLADAAADAAAGAVHGHVKVAPARVAVAVTTWNHSKQWGIPHHGNIVVCPHCCLHLTQGYWLLV